MLRDYTNNSKNALRLNITPVPGTRAASLARCLRHAVSSTLRQIVFSFSRFLALASFHERPCEARPLAQLCRWRRMSHARRFTVGGPVMMRKCRAVYYSPALSMCRSLLQTRARHSALLANSDATLATSPVNGSQQLVAALSRTRFGGILHAGRRFRQAR